MRARAATGSVDQREAVDQVEQLQHMPQLESRVPRQQDKEVEVQVVVAVQRELPQPLFLSSAEWLVLLDRAARRRFFTSDKEEQEFVSLLNGGDCLAAG